MKHFFKSTSLALVLTLAFFVNSLVLPVSSQAQLTGFTMTAVCAAQTWTNWGFPADWVGNFVDWLTGTTANPWYHQNLCQFYNKVFDENNQDEIFGERYTYAQLNWITNSLPILVIKGIEGALDFITHSGNITPVAKHDTLLEAITYAQAQSNISLSQNQLPSLLSKFNLAQPVAAQGYGFNALNSSIAPLWTAARNMTYFLMIILLAASAFLVMFRIKINPQTAVSIQLMIPRIFFTLIGITFSFAAAGLVIDLVYVVLGFVIYMLPTSIAPFPADTLAFLASADFWRIFLFYTASLPLLIVQFTPFVPVLGTIGAPVVIYLLLFRVLWTLTKSYYNLLLNIILGPFKIVMGLLPGQEGFSGWFRDVLAEAAVFLVIPLMFLLNMIFWLPPQGSITGFFSQFTNNIDIFGVLPNIYGIETAALPSLPLFQPLGMLGGLLGNTDTIFKLLIGLMILALMPKTADMVKEALKIKPFKYGSALGEALTDPVSKTGDFANRLTNAGKIITTRFGTKP